MKKPTQQRQTVAIGSLWIGKDGRRARLTYVSKSTIDYTNLDTGAQGTLSRTWFEANFTPLS